MSAFLARFPTGSVGSARNPLLKAGSNNVLRYFASENSNTKSSEDSSATHKTVYDLGYHGSDDRFVNGRPTLAYVQSMPTSFSSMRHEQILQLSAEGIPEAREEALIRNIMGVDEIDYDEAGRVLKTIAKANRKNVSLHHIPHKVGLVGAIFAGFASVPMVFHLGTVQAFNELYVTADVPSPDELDTWLEVGSWSWAWMEPLIGQASFLLLTMQFARSQLQNLGLMPYSDYTRDRRAKRLIELYPRYNPDFVAAFSRSDRRVALSIGKSD